MNFNQFNYLEQTTPLPCGETLVYEEESWRITHVNNLYCLNCKHCSHYTSRNIKSHESLEHYLPFNLEGEACRAERAIPPSKKIIELYNMLNKLSNFL